MQSNGGVIDGNALNRMANTTAEKTPQAATHVEIVHQLWLIKNKRRLGVGLI